MWRIPWLAALGLLGLTLLFSDCCYYFQEGSAMLTIYGKAQDSQMLLDQGSLEAPERDFLLLTKDIRHYAIDRLGLKENANYKTYARIDRQWLAMVVSACDETSFTQYLWSYPLVGSLPYKGFFEESRARKLAAELKEQRLDVMVREVDAFSTLGWLVDPLFSFMVEYSEYRTAELLIHEQAHATVFLPGKGDFNENLATFVGRQGALDWLAFRYGPGSPQIGAALDQEADQAVFRQAMQELYENLDRVYKAEAGKPRETILEAKARCLEAFKETWGKDWAPLFRGQSWRDFDPRKINNAWLMTWRNYHSASSLFADLYRACGQDLPGMIQALAAIPRDSPDPESWVRQLIGSLRPEGQ